MQMPGMTPHEFLARARACKSVAEGADLMEHCLRALGYGAGLDALTAPIVADLLHSIGENPADGSKTESTDMTVRVTETPPAEGDVLTWSVENRGEFIRAVNTAYDGTAQSFEDAKGLLRASVPHGTQIIVRELLNRPGE